MLDCFASLRIPEADCAKIRCKAVEQMATAHLKDISAYFAFMFRGGSLGDLQEVLLFFFALTFNTYFYILKLKFNLGNQ